MDINRLPAFPSVFLMLADAVAKTHEVNEKDGAFPYGQGAVFLLSVVF